VYLCCESAKCNRGAPLRSKFANQSKFVAADDDHAQSLVHSCARITAVPANLLSVATPSQVSNANSRPPQVAHYFRKSTTCAGSAAALENFQVVEQGLGANSLDAVITNLTAHAL
jgi:hypothetical protein